MSPGNRAFFFAKKTQGGLPQAAKKDKNLNQPNISTDPATLQIDSALTRSHSRSAPRTQEDRILWALQAAYPNWTPAPVLSRDRSGRRGALVKRPAFQFYPGDWLQDTGLRACSLTARGLWMDMVCFMHQGTPYGYLTLRSGKDGKDILQPILPTILARMVGGTTEEVERLLAKLEASGVFSRGANGVIFSRRMVQDEKVRQLRAAGRVQSLNNPNVPRPKPNGRTPSRISSDPSLGGSPSSSSSSSKENPLSEPNSRSDQATSSRVGRTVRLPPQEAIRLVALLKSEIHRNKADYRITPAQERKWAVTADRMLEIDRRGPQEIADLIRWVQQDEFWMSNVLSIDTLREKFDQLQLKRERAGGNGSDHRPSDRQFVGATPEFPECPVGECDGSGWYIDRETRKVTVCRCQKRPTGNVELSNIRSTTGARC